MPLNMARVCCRVPNLDDRFQRNQTTVVEAENLQPRVVSLQPDRHQNTCWMSCCLFLLA